ncbi:MAG: hypothetical protein HYV45_02525 [Candidatus Moranbacteria bacterium]|nr:hypothetical protein [Candidatus Moranbacteria bacterium]
MEKLVTKKNVLVFLVVLVLVALLSTEELQFCRFFGLKRCPIPLDDSKEAFLFPFIVMFLLSLLTYKMKDEVFQSWFRFALWFVPVIIVFQYIFMNSKGGGNIGNNDFAIFFTSVFYVIFILVSLIKITRAYKRTKI